MKKHQTAAAAIILVLLLLFMPPVAVTAEWGGQTTGDAGMNSWPTIDQIEGTAWMVYDRGTDRILLSNNPDLAVFPASTTKIMTAVLALEAGILDETVTVSDTAVALPYGSTKAGFVAGERVVVRDVLAGLMLASGNDAAIVLAERLGGSQEGFAALMNQKAAELGMTGSHFSNPSGLHDAAHYITARDMVTLTDYAMDNEDFRELVSTVSYSMPTTNLHPYSGWGLYSNSNRFLQFGENALQSNLISQYLGIKTGNTQESGYCLVSAALTVSGHELIAVIFNVPLNSKIGNMYIYSRTLLETAAAQLAPAETQATTQIVTEPAATTLETAGENPPAATPTTLETADDSPIISFFTVNPWRTAFLILFLVTLLLIILIILYIQYARHRNRTRNDGQRRG